MPFVDGATKMKCPIYGQADLVHDLRDMPYTYKGETTTIKAAEADFCPACGEAITNPDELMHSMEQMLAFNSEVNSSHIEPAEIVAIRMLLNLDQQEAGEVLGGGINAFKHYEVGKARPPLALVKLLRLLGRHPELLPEVAHSEPLPGFSTHQIRK